MRQHVNPLSSFFQLPRRLPSPNELFENKDFPIHLDIGSARGQFLIEMSPLFPLFNHLGLEIREPLVVKANRDCERLCLKNLHFLFCNVNVSLKDWLYELPSNLLQRVSIQFPDPWYKNRHKKRRVLQTSLLIALASALKPGCELFIQSDVLSVIEPMEEMIKLSNCFNLHNKHSKKWLDYNPYPIKSEREIYALSKSKPVYRALFYRNKNQLPDELALELIYNKELLII